MTKPYTLAPMAAGAKPDRGDAKVLAGAWSAPTGTTTGRSPGTPIWPTRYGCWPGRTSRRSGRGSGRSTRCARRCGSTIRPRWRRSAPTWRPAMPSRSCRSRRALLPAGHCGGPASPPRCTVPGDSATSTDGHVKIQAALRADYLDAPPAVADAYVAAARSTIRLISAYTAEIAELEDTLAERFRSTRTRRSSIPCGNSPTAGSASSTSVSSATSSHHEALAWDHLQAAAA